MKMIQQPRALKDIESELSLALCNKTFNMLHVGRLLNEAKDVVEHGEWLPWLRRHTALSPSSAQNYMKAAAWVDDKFPTVGNLGIAHLSPGAIYALASGKHGPETVERVLDAAATATRHLNELDVREIAKRGAKATILQEIEADQRAQAEAEAKAKAAQEVALAEWEAVRQAELAKDKQKWDEVDRILDDGPDPELPPPPEPVAASSETFHVATLERAVGMLRSVMTKPLSTFASANLSPNDIEQITAFLQEVAKQIAEKRRAA
jgi:hypothetical protein